MDTGENSVKYEKEDRCDLEDVSDINESFVLSTLVPVQKLPEKYRCVFPQYKYFNRIQSEAFDTVFENDDSLVISAPTGSGKTAIFELAILRLLHLSDSMENTNFKIIYVAPMKALCEERLVDWHKRFSSVGINCISVTGDSDSVSFQSLLNHNLIITTPEKWDSLTRHWRGNGKFVYDVALFMIDEVHLLNDESRGPTLEAIICRMKSIEESKILSEKNNKKNIRYIAVSATIPNAEDIALWMGSKQKPAKYFVFGNETRPVKLKKIVLGFYYNPQTSTPFKFDITLNFRLKDIILQHSNGKPTLIFCNTRKSVEMSVKYLAQNLTIRLSPDEIKIIQDVASSIQNDVVRDNLMHGIGCHHAGMLVEHRKAVEELFRNGNLPILVTTSTLSMGVNLPAHLVIIKSTKYYSNGMYKDYSDTTLLQMIGRAGRPQFDSSATAVILTTASDKAKFESMVGGDQCIESNLHKNLTEHLNAEIALKTISDLSEAMRWILTTFLHVRATKNPKYYGFPHGLTPDQIEHKLQEICQIEVNKLTRCGMIMIDQTSGIAPTEVGTLMAKYCIHFETMKQFTKVVGNEILQQILSLISSCHEFSDLYLRVDDKRTLNLLNKCKDRETIRFPLSGKIKTLDMKINCIIQAVFGRLQIIEPSLINEAQKIMRIGERVSKCLADYLEKRQKCYNALYAALILAKCFHAKIWEDSPYVSIQLSGIGTVTSNSLVQAGKTTFKSIYESNPRNIEMIIHRKSPMGDNIQLQIEHLPNYELVLKEIKMSETVSKIQVEIRLLNSQKIKENCTLELFSVMALLVGDDNNNILLYEKFKHSTMIDTPEIIRVLQTEFNSEIKIYGHFISENWVGIDCKEELTLFQNLPKGFAEAPTVTRISKNKKPLEKCIKITAQPEAQKFIQQYFQIARNIADQKQNRRNNSKEEKEEEPNFQELDENEKYLKKKQTSQTRLTSNQTRKQNPKQHIKENEENETLSEDDKLSKESASIRSSYHENYISREDIDAMLESVEFGDEEILQQTEDQLLASSDDLDFNDSLPNKVDNLKNDNKVTILQNIVISGVKQDTKSLSQDVLIRNEIAHSEGNSTKTKQNNIKEREANNQNLQESNKDIHENFLVRDSNSQNRSNKIRRDVQFIKVGNKTELRISIHNKIEQNCNENANEEKVQPVEANQTKRFKFESSTSTISKPNIEKNTLSSSCNEGKDPMSEIQNIFDFSSSVFSAANKPETEVNTKESTSKADLKTFNSSRRRLEQTVNTSAFKLVSKKEIGLAPRIEKKLKLQPINTASSTQSKSNDLVKSKFCRNQNNENLQKPTANLKSSFEESFISPSVHMNQKRHFPNEDNQLFEPHQKSKDIFKFDNSQQNFSNFDESFPQSSTKVNLASLKSQNCSDLGITYHTNKYTTPSTYNNIRNANSNLAIFQQLPQNRRDLICTENNYMFKNINQNQDKLGGNSYITYNPIGQSENIYSPITRSAPKQVYMKENVIDPEYNTLFEPYQLDTTLGSPKSGISFNNPHRGRTTSLNSSFSQYDHQASCCSNSFPSGSVRNYSNQNAQNFEMNLQHPSWENWKQYGFNLSENRMQEPLYSGYINNQDYFNTKLGESNEDQKNYQQYISQNRSSCGSQPVSNTVVRNNSNDIDFNFLTRNRKENPDRSAQKRQLSTTARAMELEDRMMFSPKRKKLDIMDFKPSPTKKITYNFKPNYDMSDSKIPKNQKTLSWRSPLITSSPPKYTPSFTQTSSQITATRDVSQNNKSIVVSNNKTAQQQKPILPFPKTSSFPLKRAKSLSQFPVSDEECDYANRNNQGDRIAKHNERAFEGINDILTTPFRRGFNPPKPKEIKHESAGNYVKKLRNSQIEIANPAWESNMHSLNYSQMDVPEVPWQERVNFSNNLESDSILDFEERFANGEEILREDEYLQEPFETTNITPYLNQNSPYYNVMYPNYTQNIFDSVPSPEPIWEERNGNAYNTGDKDFVMRRYMNYFPD